MNCLRWRIFGLVLLALAAGGMLLANLVFGSGGTLWPGRGQEPLTQAILLELRLPRVLAAFAVGGLLGLAGALIQVLTRNPLADPYILGISSGAATGALLAILFGLPLGLQHFFSVLGALATLLGVIALAHGEGAWTRHRLLLTGVVLAAALGALITLLLALAPETALRGMVFWLMGDLASAPAPWFALIGLLALILLIFPWGRDLNILTRGEASALALGVAVPWLRWGAYLIAAVATALAVITAGSIGFVGLLAPHLARLLVGADHRLALPGAILLGGSLVMLADLLARTLIAPQQLPTGALLTLIGAPLFLALLRREGRR
ncbi:MAG: iron ABC transporter permease [Halothiobacillaceae bacterium]